MNHQKHLQECVSGMFVYAIVNSQNLKLYIGKTIRSDLDKYLREKVWCAQTEKYRGRSRLFAAMQKYPSTVWSIHPLFQGQTDVEICAHEKLLVKATASQNPVVGYNIRDGGVGGSYSSEHCLKMSGLMKIIMNRPSTKTNVSAAQRKRFANPENRKKHALAFATSSAKENRKVAQAWRLTHSPIEHTEQWKQGQSKRALRWHHDPTNCGARLLRAQRISASKKAKSKPLLEKTCPTCMKTFFIKFKERNRRIYCSKSCASRRRWQSCKENS